MTVVMAMLIAWQTLNATSEPVLVCPRMRSGVAHI